jgi:hypothetical protein
MGHNGSSPTGSRAALALNRDGARAIEASRGPGIAARRRPRRASAGDGLGEMEQRAGPGSSRRAHPSVAWPPHNTPGLGPSLKQTDQANKIRYSRQGPHEWRKRARVAQPLPRGNPCISRPSSSPAARRSYRVRAQAFPTNHSHRAIHVFPKKVYATLHYTALYQVLRSPGGW